MSRNYYRKLSASIYHHAKNVGIIGGYWRIQKWIIHLMQGEKYISKSRNVRCKVMIYERSETKIRQKKMEK